MLGVICELALWEDQSFKKTVMVSSEGVHCVELAKVSNICGKYRNSCFIGLIRYIESISNHILHILPSISFLVSLFSKINGGFLICGFGFSLHNNQVLCGLFVLAFN